jgi:hypothetical protein
MYTVGDGNLFTVGCNNCNKFLRPLKKSERQAISAWNKAAKYVAKKIPAEKRRPNKRHPNNRVATRFWGLLSTLNNRKIP